MQSAEVGLQEDNTPEAEPGEEMQAQKIEKPAGEEEEEKVHLPEEKPIEEEQEELREKYLRLYAEFENYKKRIVKDKEWLVRYANESLIYELLPSIDHLEIALQHSGADVSQGLKEGVEITLREMMRTLEKFGLTQIESTGKPFNPEFHHAMSQVQREDIPEGMVVEELRRGYIYRDKVLRASFVSVSKQPQKAEEDIAEDSNKINIEEMEE